MKVKVLRSDYGNECVGKVVNVVPHYDPAKCLCGYEILGSELSTALDADFLYYFFTSEVEVVEE